MEKYLYFHWADYTIFGAFLVLFTLIGVVVSWLDRKKTSAKDYLTGGGQSHWAMVALSMQASFLSAIFILSGPGEIYSYGTVYSYSCIGTVLAMPLASLLFLPIYYRLNIISAYEYLERRFNVATRILASAVFCLEIILYLSVVLYAPALALTQATGFSIAWSISFCGVVCTTYTCLGGMKATIWNDTIQMGVIYLGLIMAVVRGITAVGGVGELLDINKNGGRIVTDEFRLDPTWRTTFWTQTLGGMMFFASAYVTNQSIIQKVIASRSMVLAKKSLYLSMASSIVVCLIVTLLGMAAYAFYHDCDPVESGRIEKIDQIVPLIIIELLGGHPGLPGLFMASIFSAALSSMSGCLNSLAAVVLTDFVLPVYNRNSRVMSEIMRVHLSRIFVLSFGVLATLLSFQAHLIGESVMRLSATVLNCAGGPMLGLITLGMLIPFTDGKGALTGFVTGFILTFWIALGGIYSGLEDQKLPMEVHGCPSNDSLGVEFTRVRDTTAVDSIRESTLYIYKISFYWYGVIGFLITVLVGVLVSLIPGKSKKVDPDLVYQFFWKRKPELEENETKTEEDSFLEKPPKWNGNDLVVTNDVIQGQVDLNRNNVQSDAEEAEVRSCGPWISDRCCNRSA